MKPALILYALLEIALATLFGVVIMTQGLNTWAYWTLAGLFIINLIFGLALLARTQAKRRTEDQTKGDLQ